MDKLTVKDIEKLLSKQEMELVNYHRNSIKNNTYGYDSEGYPVTVYSNTIQIPEGKYKGKFTTVPGWFDGKQYDHEEPIWNKWKKEIEMGKWPIYNDPKEGDSRAKMLHGIMDKELYLIPKQKQVIETPFYKDPFGTDIN